MGKSYDKAAAANTGPGNEQQAAPTQRAAMAEAVIYLGPSKRGSLHVSGGTVFKAGALPAHLADVVRRHGDFARLFVPVSQAGAARRALKDSTTDLARAFRAAAKLEG